MQKSALLLVMIGGMLLATGCNLFSFQDAEPVATLGEPFEVKEGETATIEGADGTTWTVTFVRKTTESRCPMDVVCVWGGEAIIELQAQGTTFELGIGEARNAPNTFDLQGFAFTLVQLDPYPKASESNDLPSTATLRVAPIQ